MKRLFYFAYGSNMLTKRLALRVDHLGKVTPHSTYRLNGYKLAFNQGHISHSYANIVKAGSENFVEGVLYELNHQQISILNQYEGYPRNYEQQFFLLPDNNIAFAYISVDDFYYSDALPELNYLNIMILGAQEHGLTVTYNSLVKFKDANYKLKKGNKFKIK